MSHQLHIKNHYVPQTYLKRWENPSKKVYVYKTLVSNLMAPIWKTYSASAIAYYKHLYTQYLNGSESDELEIWFSNKFESPANVVIEKVIADKKLSKADWDILIRFLAAQDVRTPTRMIQHMKSAGESMSSTLQNVLDELKEKLEKKDVESIKTHEYQDQHSSSLPLKVITEFDHKNDSGILRVETYIGRSSWIYSIKHVLEHTEKILHSHRWSIIKPAKGYYWITSDNPVIKLNYTDRNNYDLLGGWGRLKGNIIFPLGPEHAMFVQIGDKPIPKGSRLSVSQTIEFRKIMAENSHRMIISKIIDNDILIYKKRLVDADLRKRENQEMERWHSKNVELEREYFSRHK